MEIKNKKNIHIYPLIIYSLCILFIFLIYPIFSSVYACPSGYCPKQECTQVPYPHCTRTCVSCGGGPNPNCNCSSTQCCQADGSCGLCSDGDL